MEEKHTTKNISIGSGFGLASVLTIIFVIMKCLGHLSWSWLWVFAPLWISAALGVGILIIVGIVLLIVYLATRNDF